MGRVLLAGLDPEQLESYFAQATFSSLTDRTVTDRGRLTKLIAECRRAGYSAVEDELAYGVVAVAVPVRDSSGRVVAALNSSSHSKRITKARLVKERLSMLNEISAEISGELNRVPGLALSTQPRVALRA
jgi:IclR family pca regulon transcriptional regulator